MPSIHLIARHTVVAGRAGNLCQMQRCSIQLSSDSDERIWRALYHCDSSHYAPTDTPLDFACCAASNGWHAQQNHYPCLEITMTLSTVSRTSSMGHGVQVEMREVRIEHGQRHSASVPRSKPRLGNRIGRHATFTSSASFDPRQP